MCLEHPKCLAILYFDKEGENGRCTFRSKMSECTPENHNGEGNEWILFYSIFFSQSFDFVRNHNE